MRMIIKEMGCPQKMPTLPILQFHEGKKLNFIKQQKVVCLAAISKHSAQHIQAADNTYILRCPGLLALSFRKETHHFQSIVFGHRHTGQKVIRHFLGVKTFWFYKEHMKRHYLPSI